MFWIDYWYIVLVLPAVLFASWAQWNVSSAFRKYGSVRTARGVTGREVAEQILRDNGITDVTVESVRGNLSDHYDPRAKKIRLSDGVYASDSIAALGVAAHEAGHAVQHHVGYSPLKLRNAIIPVCNIGSNLSMPLILLGIFMSYQPLVVAGIALFGLVTLFQLLTLPVEFNASSRAMAVLSNGGYLTPGELDGAGHMLKAAALTYVAALLVALANLLRLILLFGRRNSRD